MTQRRPAQNLVVIMKEEEAKKSLYTWSSDSDHYTTSSNHSDQHKDLNKEVGENSIYEKIKKRKSFVRKCGFGRNSAHLKYMNASMEYDKLKQGFYMAIELAIIDEDIPMSELQRYQISIKYFDKKLLHQMKDRGYDIQNISNEENNNSFTERIRKIKAAGYLRNANFFEFHDEEEVFKTSKNAYFKEILLALNDRRITDLDKIIFERAIENLDKKFMKDFQKQKQNFLDKRYDERINDTIRHDGEQSVQGMNFARNRGYARGSNFTRDMEFARGSGTLRGRSMRGRGFDRFNFCPY